MQQQINISLAPEDAADNAKCLATIAKQLHINPQHITHLQLTKQSIDARKKQIIIQQQYQIWIDEQPQPQPNLMPGYPDVRNAPEIIIVGAGPAGLFAALRLIELGLRPIIVERGKDISARKIDLAQLNRHHTLDPESNYAFGEGGAGTFSDGKLFTRSNKRGNTQKILQTLVHHGANPNILIDTHPHLGTDKLPTIIKNIRQTILNAGGQIHFQTKMTDLLLDGNKTIGIEINNAEKLKSPAVILATGHSARDIYTLLDNKKIPLQPKTWAMGVRLEHPQELIDQIQYHSPTGRGNYLPAATYTLSTQAAARGVYSFCMCPGGFIVPAMTAPMQMVVNGMSPSARNSPFANAAIVVEIHPEDIGEYQNHGTLGPMHYQMEYERLAYINGGRGITAPAQRLTDFLSGRISPSLPPTTYIPGIIPSPMHFWMPEHISTRLQQGLKTFGQQARGFITDQAQLIGVESRTSSPIRIPRDPQTLQHITIAALYPCAEGAGYAGGIVSAAIDGEQCAEKAAAALK